MLNRRNAALAISCFAIGSKASAQLPPGYPERQLRIVVPLAAGGLADITYRLIATKLGELLGKPVVVENIPGAGSVPAVQAALRGRPDGYTLMGLVSGMATAPSLIRNLPYDPVKDFAPVGFMSTFDLVMLSNAEGSHANLRDLLAAARAQPGRLNIGTVNPGSIQNLTAELFRSVAGVQYEIIPFKSTPEATTALLANRVDAIFESYGATRSLVEAGKLRAIATTGPRRTSYLPNVPTVVEAGVPGFDVQGWVGLGVPAGTPPEIVQLLNRHLNSAVASADFAKRMTELGNDARSGPAEDLRTRLSDDVKKWATVIKQANISPQ